MNDNRLVGAGMTFTFPCPPLSARARYFGIVKVVEVLDGVVTFKQLDDQGDPLDTNYVQGLEGFRRELRSADRR